MAGSTLLDDVMIAKAGLRAIESRVRKTNKVSLGDMQVLDYLRQQATIAEQERIIREETQRDKETCALLKA